METLNADVCAKNGEIVLTGPSAVSFKCTYENPGGVTTYRWSMDGKNRTEFTSDVAKISIPSGPHSVTCEAFIETAGCTCTDRKSFNVSVVGMQSSVTQSLLPAEATAVFFQHRHDNSRTASEYFALC